MSSQTGDESAYGPRRPLLRLLRGIRAVLVRALLKIHNQRCLPLEGQLGRRFAAIPPTHDQCISADLSARLAWYIGSQAALIGVSSDFQADHAPYLDPDLVEAGRELVTPSTTTEDSDCLLIHGDVARSLGTAWRERRPAVVIDPRWFNLEELSAYELLSEIHLGSPDALDVLPDRLRAIEEIKPVDRAVLLLTGPSATSVELDASAPVRMICNSAVRNREILEAFQPNMIFCADPVFHFGPSRYAADFRRDLVRAAEMTDAVIIAPEHGARLLNHHIPRISGRVVPMQTVSGSDWLIPEANKMRVRQTGNVLTQLMLPVALWLASDIQIVGADGRNPSDRYFWQHNTRVQYSAESLNSAFSAHPSFFRDRLYADYYSQHCRELAALVHHGEDSGKTISSLTPSHIPCLANRLQSAE